jgi:hypothetical protein
MLFGIDFIAIARLSVNNTASKAVFVINGQFWWTLDHELARGVLL